MISKSKTFFFVYISIHFLFFKKTIETFYSKILFPILTFSLKEMNNIHEFWP